MSPEKMLEEMAAVVLLPAMLSVVGMMAAFLTLFSACSQVIREGMDTDDKERAETKLRQVFNETVRLGFLCIAVLGLCFCFWVPVAYVAGFIPVPKSIHLPLWFEWGASIAFSLVLGNIIWLVLHNLYVHYQDIQLRLPPWLQRHRNQDS